MNIDTNKWPVSASRQEIEFRHACSELFVDPDSAEAPSLAVAKEELGPGATMEDLNLWILRWQLARGELDVELSARDQVREWTPSGYDQTALVLLPVNQSWDALTYLNFYPCWDNGSLSEAMFRSWHERFGAEIWACSGVTLELAVQQPPADIDTAWTAAFEQCKIAGLTGEYFRSSLKFANALIGRDRSLLFDRP